MDIKIVEYKPSLAAKVADMWTRSGDSWGGFNAEFTEETVRREEEQSVYENLFLAMVNDEVVGYCKLARWTEEEGALYVDVLNVRPDMHGKKIGKALMLRTVERTRELGWPRLDLHTWAGNTKAVPLYKKTGFFWEERDSEVYLVNFIPSLLNNSLAKEFFENADWYVDSTRPIAVRPDGRKENGFTYFTYSWQKGDRFLRMEYARRGRGLRSIETNSLKIQASVCEPELPFGRNYSVEYLFENRTDTPMQIEVEGLNDRNITFDFTCSREVLGTVLIRGRFSVGRVEFNQDDWKTHPCVKARISVNGAAAIFAVGVVPTFPVDIRSARKSAIVAPDTEQTFFLNLENNLPAKAAINLQLPDTEEVTVGPVLQEKILEPGQRDSLEIGCKVRRGCVYSPRLQVSVTCEGDVIEYSKNLSVRFGALSGMYSGQVFSGDNIRSVIAAGPLVLALAMQARSHINQASLHHDGAEAGAGRFLPPKLGKPYSEEFIHKKVSAIQMHQEPGAMLMHCRYDSGDFPGIAFSMFLRVHAGGIAERWFELRNTGKDSLREPLRLLDGFRFPTERLVAPYDGRYLGSEGDLKLNFFQLDAERLTENWLFSRGRRMTVGAIWDSSVKPLIGDWAVSIEHDCGCLEPGGTYTTKPVRLYVNTFSSWLQCRRYATGKEADSSVRLEDAMALEIAGGNPFLSADDTPFAVEERRNAFLDGRITVTDPDGNDIELAAAQQEKRHRIEACLEIPASGIITADFNMNVLGIRQSRSVFQTGVASIKTEQYAEQHEKKKHDIFRVENGEMVVQYSRQFGPLLYSCRYKGVEWLGNSYPAPGPRDWWNPWLGGYMLRPAKLEVGSILKEEWETAFTRLNDTFGNEWEGLEITVAFSKHKDLKGMRYIMRFLMLPGVPVLMLDAEVRLSHGRFEAGLVFDSQLFAADRESAANVYLHGTNYSGKPYRVRSGKEEAWYNPLDILSITKKDSRDMLTIYANRNTVNLTAVTNKQTTLVLGGEKISGKAGETVHLTPRFLIFSQDAYTEEMLQRLNGIKIERVG